MSFEHFDVNIFYGLEEYRSWKIACCRFVSPTYRAREKEHKRSCSPTSYALEGLKGN